MLCGLGMQQCFNSLHPWCIAVWVCNNAQCNNSDDNLFELGVYSVSCNRNEMVAIYVIIMQH